MSPLLNDILYYWNHTTFYYYVLVNCSYLVLTTVSFVVVRGYMRGSALHDSKLRFQFAGLFKPISILAPAHNEEVTVVENVRSLLNLNYPAFEVVLINDGSSDGTLEVLRQTYGLEPAPYAPLGDLPTARVKQIYRSVRHPSLVVIDKENGGKADALNTGINHARYPLFLAIDTDSLLERDALMKMVQPFLERPETLAVGGIVRAVNGCTVRDGEVVDVRLPRNHLAAMQIIEYLKVFLFGRVGWAAMNMLVVISGAFGLFKRQAVLDAGGYSKTVGEDMELIVRLHRMALEKKQHYHIGFVPDPVCWTEVPESLGVLSRQRNRWSRGQTDTLRIHRKMLFNPAYGRIGMIALPYALIVESLGAFVEIAGFIVLGVSIYLGQATTHFLIGFFAVSILFGGLISLWALILEELTFRRIPRLRSMLALFVYGIAESLGYHQLAVWWRVKGMIDYFRGKSGWGHITRTGFAGRPTTQKQAAGAGKATSAAPEKPTPGGEG